MKALDELLKSKKYKKIPFQFLKTQHLLLKAEINGVKGRFILDTGASHSCLNRDVKDKFLVQTQPSTTTVAGAGAVNMETLLSVKNSLKIGSWKKEEFSIVLFDLHHVNQALSTYNVKEVDGIIGADVLMAGEAIIDYAFKKLYLK